MHNRPECREMAPEDDKELIEAVVTCEGNLHDPDFSERFQILLGNLKSILYKPRDVDLLKVKKIEPWNSVRVTISIPKEAAQKLRLLAQEGSTVLRTLGILTVQLEGDQVISLTLAGQNNETTEIVLRQNDGSSSSSTSGGPSIPSPQLSLPLGPGGASVPLAILSSSPSTSAFRSPNVVAPAGESIPFNHLPPKSSTVNPRPSSFGGPFPFASMTHAAQTMQRTDPALQHSTNINNNGSSNPLSNNINSNNNAVHSTNFPRVPSPASPSVLNPSSPFNSHPSPSISSVTGNVSLNRSTQQQGHFNSEQVSRFVLGPNVSQASPQSQSLQLQVNVNAPPPYTGVNSSNSSSNFSSSKLISNSSSSNNFNHHHQQLNSVITSNNNMSVSTNSLTFVGAPPSPSSTVNGSQIKGSQLPMFQSQNSESFATQGGFQQPMSSPLLVNLLQNSEATTQNPPRSQPQQGQTLNMMLPPDQQKRFVAVPQQRNERKIKRAVSVDGASVGESGNTKMLMNTLSGCGTPHLAPASAPSDSPNLPQFMLPSSPLESQGVPIRPSSELATTATIIQGRTIIHQGGVRVFNSGQIRAIRLNQTDSSIPPSPFQLIQGNSSATATSVMSEGSEASVNGPHPPLIPNPSPQQQQFPPSTSTISSLLATSSNQADFNPASAVNVSVDQSSRTSMNSPATTFATLASAISSSYSNSSNNYSSNTFIPPSSEISSSSSSLLPIQQQQKHATAPLPPPVTPQQIKTVVQSLEAKSSPSHPYHHHRGLPSKSSKEPTLPPSQLTTSSGKPRQLLINPLTGHLEPMPSESSSDSDEEQVRTKPRSISRAKATLQHRQIVTTTTGVTVARVVKSASLDSQKSDVETLKTQAQQRVTVHPVTVPSQASLRKSREDVMISRESVNPASSDNPGEKIKLRLKLEKNEPIAPAYKVEHSFMKKSEKAASMSSTSGAVNPYSSLGPMGSPGETPRVPPLHISLRGKNAAVVVNSPRRDDNRELRGFDDDKSSSPTSLSIDSSKLTSSLIKGAKRTKGRIRSSGGSGGDSDSELGKHIKALAAKVNRPRLSKESVGGQSAIEEEPVVDSLKTRLGESIDLLEKPLVSTTPVSVVGEISKDLITGTNKPSPIVVASLIPTPNVKLKKSRRKSESELSSRLQIQPPSALSPVPNPTTKDLSKVLEEPASVSPTNESSSLLFQHLSKNEESPNTPSTLQPQIELVTQSTNVPSTSAYPLVTISSSSLPSPLSSALETVNAKSVLTLTSTVTTEGTVSPGVKTTALVEPTATPTKITLPLSKDSNTLPVSKASGVEEVHENIPELKRENIPKKLDLVVTSSGVINIPDGKQFNMVSIPNVKSPKPLPELLTVALKSSETDVCLPSAKQISSLEPESSIQITKVPIPPLETTVDIKMVVKSLDINTVPVAADERVSPALSTSTLEIQHVTLPVSPVKVPGSKLSSGSKRLADGPVVKKEEKSPKSSLPVGTSLKLKGSPLSSLRPKVKAPKASIGTSIDADLPTFTPTPSLKELLEKDKILIIKKEPVIDNDLKSEVQQEVIASNALPIPVKDTEITIRLEKENLHDVKILVDSQDDIKNPAEKVEVQDPAETTTSPALSQELEIAEPIVSTVIPNAPLPFPLVLTKAEDHSGLPGEDSGIDSMDALSEKSPNQGESPIRKEPDQYVESHNTPPQYNVLPEVKSVQVLDEKVEEMKAVDLQLADKVQIEEKGTNTAEKIEELKELAPEPPQSGSLTIELGKVDWDTSIVNTVINDGESCSEISSQTTDELLRSGVMTNAPFETPKNEGKKSPALPIEIDTAKSILVETSTDSKRSTSDEIEEEPKTDITLVEGIIPESSSPQKGPILASAVPVEEETKVCPIIPSMDSDIVEEPPLKRIKITQGAEPINLEIAAFPQTQPSEDNRLAKPIVEPLLSSSSILKVEIEAEVVEKTIESSILPSKPEANLNLSTPITIEKPKEFHLDSTLIIEKPNLTPLVINHIDAIQELHNHAIKLQHQPIKPTNKVRKAKLEDIVAAIGTKNIEKQLLAKEGSESLSEVICEPGNEIVAVSENRTSQELTSVAFTAEKVPSVTAPAKDSVLVNHEENSNSVIEYIPISTTPQELKTNHVEDIIKVGRTKGVDMRTSLERTVETLPHIEGTDILPKTGEKSTAPFLESTTLETARLEKDDKSTETPIPTVSLLSTRSPSILLPVSKSGDLAATELTTKLEPVIVERQSLQDVLQLIKPIEKNLLENPEEEKRLENLPIKIYEKQNPVVNCSNIETLKQPSFLIPTIAAVEKPPPISIVDTSLTSCPQKPILEPHAEPKVVKSRSKSKPGPASPGTRRIPDGPPKLSKATETDPRPECANPPRLEMRKVEEMLKVPIASSATQQQPLPVSIPSPKIQVQTVAPSKPQGVSVSLAATGQRNLSNLSNILQLTKSAAVTLTQAQAAAVVSKIPMVSLASTIQNVTATVQNCTVTSGLTNALPSSLASLAMPLPVSAASGGTGQTVFALHPTVSLPANFSHLHSHGSSAITVLSSAGGHKMVPIKLVTLPKQSTGTGQFQSIPLTGITPSRASPNLLEAVNFINNSGSRSNSPKLHIGNSIQNSNPLNLSSVQLAGGNIHFVPVSLASTVGGSVNPVKVLMSSPIKMQQSMHQPMMVKSVMVGQQAGTIRVARPSDSNQTSCVPPANMILHPRHVESLLMTSPTGNAKIVAPTEEKKSTAMVQSIPVLVKSSEPPMNHPLDLAVISKKLSESETSEEAAALEEEDDDLPFEADIIHDEKDLEDVLADESLEETTVVQNGIDGHHSDDDENTGNNSTKSRDGISKVIAQTFNHKSLLDDQLSKDSSSGSGEGSNPESPIPMIRSSSPLFTYGNRCGKNSRPSTRSPSPSESDVHGEDQEIIDSFTRSPSQPKLSPQNQPIMDTEEHKDRHPSPHKPELTTHNEGDKRTLNQELSIEIPPVELISMSPFTQQNQHVEERKSTRSTRSNTRLVSPDITAFRSDTPKPTKFSTKPDSAMLKNSPKPSPTGSFKMLSPTVSGLTITPSSSNRSSPLLLTQTYANATSAAVGAMEKINQVGNASTVTNLIRGTKSTGGSNKRKRQESDSSSASKDENVEDKPDIDLNSRPGKRRCSENAAELIKACIGSEDTPKRNSMLIKRMEESKLKEATKLKKAMATLVEENEDDTESVASSMSRGRGGGMSSRGSSEDRSSSRGSSVQRSTATSKHNNKDDDLPKEQKLTSKANVQNKGKEKPKTGTGRESPSQNVTVLQSKKAKVINNSGRRSNRGFIPKDKSPLLLAKTRTNLKRELENSIISHEKSTGTASTANSPEAGNVRRKTRSSVAGAGKRHVDLSESDLAALKRRRMSKDSKS